MFADGLGLWKKSQIQDKAAALRVFRFSDPLGKALWTDDLCASHILCHPPALLHKLVAVKIKSQDKSMLVLAGIQNDEQLQKIKSHGGAPSCDKKNKTCIDLSTLIKQHSNKH